MNIDAMRMPFFHALCLLTRIPAPKTYYHMDVTADILARSIVFYAPVGLVIGGILALVILLFMPIFPSLMLAALLLSVWVILTGALHLDGFADCCDAFFAHHKGPNITRRVMKEPQLGAMAVVGLVVLLVIKFSALACLSVSLSHSVVAVLSACVAARLAAAHYMLCTAYVSDNAMVSGVNFNGYKKPILMISVLSVLLGVLCLGLNLVLTLGIVLTAAMLGWRKLWRKILGGYTGDCVGGLIEIIECLTLIVFVGFI